MLEKIMNLLFRCRHHRLSRPLSPATKAGDPRSRSYVVCLDCGKHFDYDTTLMRLGKVIDPS